MNLAFLNSIFSEPVMAKGALVFAIITLVGTVVYVCYYVGSCVWSDRPWLGALVMFLGVSALVGGILLLVGVLGLLATWLGLSL